MEIVKENTTTMKKQIFFTELGVKSSLKTEVLELKNTMTEMGNRLEELSRGLAIGKEGRDS